MSQNQPAHFPNNPIVEHFLAVQRINAERGAQAGRSYVEGSAIDAGPGPSVQSAALGKAAPEPRPLTPEEVAERNQKAVDLGIMSPEEAGMMPEDGNYSSLDAALAAGESVRAPEPVRLVSGMDARRASFNTPDPVSHAGRWPSASPPRPRLIDFRKIEYVDLQRGVAVVDGFDIDMPAQDLRAIKEHVLRLAVDYITSQLTAALMEVMSSAPGKPGNESGAQQEVATGSASGTPTSIGLHGGEGLDTSSNEPEQPMRDLRSSDVVPPTAGILEAGNVAVEPETQP